MAIDDKISAFFRSRLLGAGRYRERSLGKKLGAGLGPGKYKLIIDDYARHCGE